jgi:hypothetical protein
MTFSFVSLQPQAGPKHGASTSVRAAPWASDRTCYRRARKRTSENAPSTRQSEWQARMDVRLTSLELAGGFHSHVDHRRVGFPVRVLRRVLKPVRAGDTLCRRVGARQNFLPDLIPASQTMSPFVSPGVNPSICSDWPGSLAAISIITLRPSEVAAWSSLAWGGAPEAAFASSWVPEPAVSPEQPDNTAASTITTQAILPTRATLKVALFICPFPVIWKGDWPHHPARLVSVMVAAYSLCGDAVP